MTKLEEIKAHLNSTSENGEAYVKIFTTESVLYLLSKIEKAEKAFEKLSTGNFFAPIELSQVEAYQAYANSALQSIRDD